MNADHIEAVLQDLRQWMQQASEPIPMEELPAEMGMDPLKLAEQFTALRQEVNLQTRSTRTLVEQYGQAVEQLRIDFADLPAQFASELEAQRPTPPPVPPAPPAFDDDDRWRAALKIVIDLYDSLALAGRSLERTLEMIRGPLDLLDQLPVLPKLPEWPVVTPTDSTYLPSAVEMLSHRSGWFTWRKRSPEIPQNGAIEPDQRLRSLDQAWRDWHQMLVIQLESETNLRQEASKRQRQLVDSIASGYTMSIQRIDRALTSLGLEPIAALGDMFDPDTMEVVEVTPDSEMPAGEVLEEVRRGYRRKGRVFRFAQVRVAR